MNKTIFVTGIGTKVGKTVASAVITQALEADYFKPIQAGGLDNSDTHKVKRWVNSEKTKFHDSAYQLKTPMSPHAAAEIDGVKIKKKLSLPKTKNTLVIEGAGGLMVPINDQETIADMIPENAKIVLVSLHYLGSINHTLLSLELLKNRGLTCKGIIFMGDENLSTESIIKKQGKTPILGRIDQEPYIDDKVVQEYARKFK